MTYLNAPHTDSHAIFETLEPRLLFDAAGLPDFAFAEGEINVTAQAGETIEIPFELLNIGGAPAATDPATVTVTFLPPVWRIFPRIISTCGGSQTHVDDTFVPASQQIVETVETMVAVPVPGLHSAGSFTWVTPERNGNYSLVLIADLENLIAEADEDNNYLQLNFTITGGLPEIVLGEPEPTPASGDVTAKVVRGRLIVKGDRESNDIRIDQTDLAEGQYRLYTGEGSETTFNGQAGEIIISGVTRGVKINTGAGDDSLDMDGVNVFGDLSIRTGAGDDWVDLSGVEVDGDVSIKTGGGADGVKLAGLTVGENLKIATGRHADIIEINNSQILGDTRIATGGGNDELLLETWLPEDEAGVFAAGESAPGGDVTTFGGKVTVKLGRGDDTWKEGVVNSLGFDVIYQGKASFRPGKGNDAVIFFNSPGVVGHYFARPDFFAKFETHDMKFPEVWPTVEF